MTALAEGRPPVVTVLRHNAHASEGRFVGWLEASDLRTLVVALDDGDEVPALGDVGQGLIVLGGSMNARADEEYPFLARERDLLGQAVEAELPTLGICLGHQLLGVTLGGRLEIGAQAGPERGVTRVTWAPEAAEDPVARRATEVARAAAAGEEAQDGAARRGASGDGRDGAGEDGVPGARPTADVLQFHDDAIVEAPPGATVLASSERYAVQAFRVGSALGVQFHPEATPDMLGRWARRRPETAGEEGAIVAAAREADASVARTGRALADGFAMQVRAGI